MAEKVRTLTDAKAEAKLKMMEKFLADNPNAVQIDDAEFVVPVEDAQFGVQYVAAPFSVKDTKGTKGSAKQAPRAGFTLDGALAAYEQKKADRLAAAIAKVNAAK